MKIDNLTLNQFRNIRHASLKFQSNIVVFVGDNGQGKTNILESLVFLSYGRSFRVNDDKMLIEYGKDFARIEAECDDSTKLKVVISEAGKYMTVNQKPLKKLSEFIGFCNVVLFNPDDLNFFSEQPRYRRRNFDLELGKLDPRYVAYLTQHQRIYSERNACLKGRTIDDAYLEVLTDKLVECSLKIIAYRRRFVEKLIPKIQLFYEQFVVTGKGVSLDYKDPVGGNESVEQHLKKKYAESLERDKELGFTQIGIHKDDYIFKMDAIPVSHTLSQGQKRLLMVAYKLALVEVIYESTKAYPILCLDDLFSELDTTRRKQVLEVLPEALQVFITTTDYEFVDTFKNKQIIRIEDGKIIEEEDYASE